MPQLDATYYASQIFWLAISFCIIFVVFTKVLLPSIMNAISLRNEKIDSITAKSLKILAQAEALSKEAEKVIQKAYEDTKVYKTRIVNDLNSITRSSLIEFERSAAMRTQESLAKLEILKKNAEKDVNEAILKYAGAMILKISGKKTEQSVLGNIYRSII